MRKELIKFIIPILLVMSLTGLFIPWQIVLVLTFIFSLFFITNLKYHNLKNESFEITATNKDPLTPMHWYRDEIISQMYVLRWNLIEDSGEKKVWRPRGMTRVMEDSFTMTYSPYIIHISGSRNMITMMKSLLEFEKIFL